MSKVLNIGRLRIDLRPKQAEKDNAGNWWYFNEIIGSILSGNGKLDKDNAFLLALSVAEIFYPIDMIADRVASLPYVKVNKNMEIVDFSQQEERLLKNPNIFTTGEQLIYALVFSELADGNSYLYTKLPDSYRTVTTDRISSLWCLRPDNVSIAYKGRFPDLYSTTKKSDIIDHYSDGNGLKADPDRVIHNINMPFTVEEGLNLKGKSPLCSVERNVNNLLAVYNARYNVYSNNGIAGIISKEKGGVNGDLEQSLNPTTRKEIADELMDDYNLTGSGNIKAITSVPVKFIKTLATISELEPFRETFADASQIAGIYGVVKELLPREDNTTFNNQRDAEKFLWQNRVKGIAEDIGKTLTKALAITDGEIVPVFDDVEVLQTDRKESLEADGIELDNYKKMQELGLDISDLATEIKKKYEKS